MKLTSRFRTASAGLALAALAATTLAVGGGSPLSAQEGPVGHFVVLGPAGGLAGTLQSIDDAGGEVLASYPQIGVVVVTSTDADFAVNVRQLDDVQGAGASRALVEFIAPSITATSSSANALDKAIERTTGRKTRAAGARTNVGAAALEPLAANQWDMRQIKADQANAVNLGSRDVLVGVLDSGIDATHPDLAPNVDAANSVGCTDEGVADTSPAAWAPTTSDHGTHVAGTIGAAHNGIGIAGVAPNVRLASVKVVDDDGFIYPEYAICGFVWAAEHGVDVTNSSWFLDPWFRWCNDDPDQKAGAEAVQRAINYAAKKNVVNVSALGNSNWDLAHDVLDEGSPDNQTPITRLTDNSCRKIPAEVNGVVGVSSVGPDKGKAYYSNYGVGDTEVAAPGGDRFDNPGTPDGNGRVLSTIYPGGGWGYKQGTSMASPHAAGVVALIRSAHPTWSASKVIGALLGQADAQPCPANPYDPTGDGAWLATCEGGSNGGGFYGKGLIDALDAVTK